MPPNAPLATARARFAAVALAALAVVAAGCGSRCHEVADARTALTSRPGAADRGPDLRVVIPFARANALLADLLRAEPQTARLDLPDLGLLGALERAFTASVAAVTLHPGAPDTVGFTVELIIRDDTTVITTLTLEAAVAPQLERTAAGAAVVLALGPDNLRTLTPTLGPDATAALGRAVAQRLPAAVRARIPQPLLDAAVARLAAHLTGAAYTGLRTTLLARLGPLTQLRLRLPDVPITDAHLHSLAAPNPALVVELHTDLPVRRGLAPLATAGPDPTVTLSGSTIAELANWSLDRGLAPAWYDRSLKPDPDGAFRPRFDYRADDRAHPFKVYAFQERHGCSYFQVGVRATLAVDHGQLRVTALDRHLERASATPVIAVAAWVKFFLTGSLDRSRALAAHTQLSLGPHTITTTVLSADLTADQLTFALGLTLTPAAAAADQR